MPLLGRFFLAPRPGSRRTFLFRAGRGRFLGGVTLEMYNEFHHQAPSDREAGRALAWRGASMPNRLALENNHWFGPEDVAALTTAFEAALGKLGLVDRSDPTTVTLAKLIIELAKAGEREPERLCDSALKRLLK